MGTPEFACPSLESLCHHPEIEIPLVISQPDAKKGRKMKLTPSPIKEKALQMGLQVETPKKVSSPEWVDKIANFKFDAVVVLAYGQILRQRLLDTVPNGFINIHASLLPRWRGAAPIQRAVMAGDEETGVSFQLMRLKLDSGPVIFEKKTKIDGLEDSFELQERLSRLHTDDLPQVVIKHIKGELEAKEQDESLVTYAQKIEKKEGAIDWSQSAQDLHNKIRGLQWGPGAYTFFKEKRLKLSKTNVVETSEPLVPGQIHQIESLDQNGKSALYIGTGSELLSVGVLQPEGKPKMQASDFVNGYGLTPGQSFL
jgi:methionyl-tRNA formyltransferase